MLTMAVGLQSALCFEVASYVLACFYFVLLCVAIVQLVRLQLFSRLWTTQKLFHLTLAALCAVRASFFVSAPNLVGVYERPATCLADAYGATLAFSASWPLRKGFDYDMLVLALRRV